MVSVSLVSAPSSPSPRASVSHRVRVRRARRQRHEPARGRLEAAQQFERGEFATDGAGSALRATCPRLMESITRAAKLGEVPVQTDVAPPDTDQENQNQ